MGLGWLRRLINPVVRRVPATSASTGIGSDAGSGTKSALCFPLNFKRFPQRPDVQLPCITKEEVLIDFGRCKARVAVGHFRWDGGGAGGRVEDGISVSKIRNDILDGGIRVQPRPPSSILRKIGGSGCSGARSFSRIIWQDDDNKAPRLLVVQPRFHPLPTLKAKLLEALRLADSLEDTRAKHDVHEKQSPKQRVLSPYVLVQSPSSSSGKASYKRLQAGSYFGAGTVDIVRVHVDQAASQGRLDAVFVNAPLSGIQQRNLEKAWGKPVFDRVGLIIRIFGAHAHTRAAKLQVELASLYYNRSRLVRARGRGGARLGFGAGGDSEVVSARGRATGAIGGAGETEIQLQRRRIGDREHRLKLLLADVDRTQTLHRAARQRQGQEQEQKHTRDGYRSGSGLPVVAVVGYTNAGKSSLVAALARTSLYVDDKLFATLDTRSRRVLLPSGQKIILSDTVGFISDLPIQLVRAFQSTLDEVVEADYLLHVIDCSAPNANEQREEVLQVLENIGVPDYKLRSCLIEVWNKVDLVGENVKPFEAEKDKFKQINNSDAVAADIGQPWQGEVLNARPDPSLDSSDSIQLWKGSSEQVLEESRVELLDPQWSHEGVSCVATSVRTRTGLAELSRLLDKNLSILPIMHENDERVGNRRTEYVGDV